MPETFNGIGTWYHGKSNVSEREGECHSCHRHATLRSYDTRLFVVILHIPVFPLGKKRVVDECSICQRHYAIPADQYAKLSAESIDKGMQEFKDDPSAETALGVHGRLVAFHKFAEAKEFREKAMQFFGNDSEFMIEMAAQLDEMSRTDELVPLLDQILKVDPGNKMIRARQAVLLSSAGEIDRARPLLDYLEKPGAFVDSSPAPLVHLADMFSKQGRHEDALKMLEHMVRELPDLGKQPAFRRMVLGIEKKAGRVTSIVPSPKRSWLGLFNPYNTDVDPRTRTVALWGLGITAALLLLGGINYYLATHRTLYIVNGFSKDMKVSIDGGPEILATVGKTAVPFAEGHHHATVRGALNEEFDFEARSGYFGRFFRSPAFVLVPGEGAMLLRTDLEYAENPGPSVNTALFGQRFQYLAHCDYPFVDPPPTLQVERNSKLKKVALSIPRMKREDMAAIVLQNDMDAGMRFCEQHLRAEPSDERMLTLFSYIGTLTDKEDRVVDFLAKGLDVRPVAVTWHRVYSNILEENGKIDEINAIYDKALQAEPDNVSLLYLKSRVDLDMDHGIELFEKARQRDPEHPWIWYSDGATALSQADFAKAKTCFIQARERGIGDDQIRGQLLDARLGLGEANEIAEEQSRMPPTDVNALEIRLRALAVAGQGDKARQEFDAWSRRPDVNTPDSRPAIDQMRGKLSYFLRDWDGLAKAYASPPPNHGFDPFRLEALMVLGRANEAELQPPPKLPGQAIEFALKMALAFDLAGDPERSRGWVEKGASLMASQAGHDRVVAESLRSTELPSYERFLMTRIGVTDKALAAAILARKFPEDGKPFADLAKKLMVARDRGSLLIAKALGE